MPTEYAVFFGYAEDGKLPTEDVLTTNEMRARFGDLEVVWGTPGFSEFTLVSEVTVMRIVAIP